MPVLPLSVLQPAPRSGDSLSTWHSPDDGGTSLCPQGAQAQRAKTLRGHAKMGAVRGNLTVPPELIRNGVELGCALIHRVLRL